MTNADAARPADSVPHQRVPTLDALFRFNAARHPNEIALTATAGDGDGGEAQSYTYSHADRVIGRIARRLREEIGLPTDSVVCIQLPNRVEAIFAALAVTRAGLIPAFLPLLWRRAECVAALTRAHAKAIITCDRAAGFNHAQLAMDVAAEVFPIRAVMAFGAALPDGVIALDDTLTRGTNIELDLVTGDAPPDEASSLAAITFDVALDGPRPVERDPIQLMASGLLICDRAAIDRQAAIVSTIPAATYAGLACVLMPWLVTAGRLICHETFAPDALSAGLQDEGSGAVLVVPQSIALRMQDADPAIYAGFDAIIAIHRAPERLATSPAWNLERPGLVDVAAFGEIAMLAARRNLGSRAAPWPLGPVRIASGAGTKEIASVALLPSGTLGIQGLLTVPPRRQANDSAPDHTDTGYGCARYADGTALTVNAAPAGFANVGGYRFATGDLQAALRSIDSGGLIAALPNALSGHRLAGHARKLDEVRETLDELGLNPLVSGAFRRP